MFQFPENTFKNFYYEDNVDEPSDQEEGTLAFKVKKAIAKRPHSIDEFFEKPKKKKLTKKSSSVGRSTSGGISYITSNKDDSADASHLIKIEVYDVNKIKNVAQTEQWKHADVRVKLFTESEADRNLQSVRDIIYNITKQLATQEECKKFFIDTDK